MRTTLSLGVFLIALAAPAWASVDLDRPGALETLERDNPAHFARALGILQAAAEAPCQLESFARVMRAKFEAKDASCGMLVMTSYPAKRRLSFTLDTVEYIAVVRMKQEERLVPAR